MPRTFATTSIKAANMPTGAPTSIDHKSTAIHPALEALRFGLPVLPVEPRGERPIARLVRQGHKDATTDPSVIRAWLAREPRMNYGLRLGSGFLVLDLDSGAAKDHAEHLGLPPTLVVKTGKGWHYYYAMSAGIRTRNVASPFGRDEPADIKAEDGYVVGPGSVHESDVLYSIVQDQPVAMAPQWLLDLATRTDEPSVRNAAVTRPVAPGRSPMTPHCRKLLADTRKGRNLRSYKAVLSMVGTGWADPQIAHVLLRSPLGARAQRRPGAWVQQKIDAARTYVATHAGTAATGETETAVDPEVWFPAMVQRRYKANHLLVVRELADRAHQGPNIMVSIGDLRIAANCWGAGRVVRMLIADGVLLRKFTPQAKTAKRAIYQLRMPVPDFDSEEAVVRVAGQATDTSGAESGTSKIWANPQLATAQPTFLATTQDGVSLKDIMAETGRKRASVQEYLRKLSDGYLVIAHQIGREILYFRVVRFEEAAQRLARKLGLIQRRRRIAAGVLYARTMFARLRQSWRLFKATGRDVAVGPVVVTDLEIDRALARIGCG
jgi:hypothetical protein